MKKALFVKLAAAVVVASPLMASAESQLVTGAGSATARLDFRVIVPRVLFLGVGTGAAGLANNATIDMVTFDYTTNPAAVGTGAAAGAITGNVVPVRVLGNNGQITLTAATTGALSNGSGDTIPWSEISATTNLAALPSPVIPATGTGAASNVTLSSGTKITDRSANWTFSYANSAVVAPGTYGATVANNGRVTYTAAMP
ncbi:hypothetical protein [Hydrogenophaga laconesensis]|uniref:Uncharacterized protein n=1 Tax=Hydrogenophaga laconesensis TaxID=1805971 RepID=A0ABU1VDL1_9BURK|nr:hypothetical protein [Hydrogenophaga laconesensis]MDR7095263.1 hypothetical protein [Hydrogenophaga laconesensis]